tara:strand:+ start:998 stop:1315 length:318 start_codon:yes stop_codon:yes gene_type:complete
MNDIHIGMLKDLQQEMNIPTAIEMGKGTELNLNDQIKLKPGGPGNPSTFTGIPIRENSALPKDVVVIKSGTNVLKVIALTEEAEPQARVIAGLIEMYSNTGDMTV